MFQQQVKSESSKKTKPHDEEVEPPLSTEPEPAKVYWPCAPDGYIPNSVVRKRVKPRKPPSRLIARTKRPEQKKKKVIEKEEEDDEQISKILGMFLRSPQNQEPFNNYEHSTESDRGGFCSSDVYHAGQYGSNFEVCGRNPHV